MKWPVFSSLFSSRRIRVYADFIDPFCYIGYHNLRVVAERRGHPLDWCGFELNPDTPDTGSILQPAANSDLHGGMWPSVTAYAQKSGLTLVEPSFVPNTRLAHLCILSLSKPHVKNTLIERFYQAYLSDKKDIGDPEVLAALGHEFGLSDKTIHTLANTRDATPLERNRQHALRYGFTGLPGFVYRQKTYFGSLPQDSWANVLEQGG